MVERSILIPQHGLVSATEYKGATLYMPLISESRVDKLLPQLCPKQYANPNLPCYTVLIMTTIHLWCSTRRLTDDYCLGWPLVCGDVHHANHHALDNRLCVTNLSTRCHYIGDGIAASAIQESVWRPAERRRTPLIQKPLTSIDRGFLFPIS